MQNNQNNDNTVSDYKELVDFLAGQFDKVNERFEKIERILETKADKSDIDKICQTLETKADKADIDHVLTRVNLLGSKLDDYRAEQIGMRRQLDKHEKWHSQTAAKVGIKLLTE